MKTRQMKLTELKDLTKAKSEVTPRFSKELGFVDGELKTVEVER